MAKKTKQSLGRLQAILVPKEKARNSEQALTRARKYGQMHIVEEMKNFYRCRRSGTDYESYHTQTLPNGIRLIRGRDAGDGHSEEDE